MSPPPPSKVIAVHVNYRSRAEQRGVAPTAPSYFLKPPSSLSSDGAPIVRPRGTELLSIEAEVALVIGRRARDITPEEGLAHIGWYAPANDVGLFDMRAADRGSNLMAKGQDGYTPLGPLVAAEGIDPTAITLRARVNGELVQEDSTANLLFPFGLLVADLSRFVTLEPGDVILTGTPAGARPVEPGDVVEIELDAAAARAGSAGERRSAELDAAAAPAGSAGERRSAELERLSRVSNPVVESAQPLAPFGAQPSVSPATRALALGVNAPRPVVLSDDATAALKTVSTATLTVQLRRHGIANTFIRGLRPTRPDLRLLGYAHTLRYVPLREDVRNADRAELNAQKRAVETISPGEVLVMDAREQPFAGTIGDILAARALARGATGIVTDGGLRDSPAVGELEIPTYFQAPHAAVLGLIHYPLEVNVPIACGGTLVMPGDVLVGDAEGVVVVPAALAERVAHDALEQESRESWALERVKAGESIRGIYPLSEARRADYDAWRAER